MSAEHAQIVVLEVDPLRVLPFPEVIRRTGYSRSTVERMLARDVIEKAPGRSFPPPLRNAWNGRMEWREIDIANWLDSRAGGQH